MATKVTKLKLNPEAAMSAHQSAASTAAVDRFAAATEIVKRQPTGLSEVVEEGGLGESIAAPQPAIAPAVTTKTIAPPQVTVPVAFDLLACIPGAIVRVPLHMIDTNPMSPRRIYTEEKINKIAKTMGDGQDVAAHGYVQDGRVKLIDGGTRYRAAKITDTSFLDIKFEVPPQDDLELFRRARALNENRSDTNLLDYALSLRTLMEKGVVKSQVELIEKVEAPGGGRLSAAAVSSYLRIARMPTKVHLAMDASPATTTGIALYTVSELFSDNMEEEMLEARTLLALDIVDEIKEKQLNRHQIEALVKSKLEGPKRRVRGESSHVKFGAHKGSLKVVPSRGEFSISFKGLSAEETEDLQKRIEFALSKDAAVSAHAAAE